MTNLIPAEMVEWRGRALEFAIHFGIPPDAGVADLIAVAREIEVFLLEPLQVEDDTLKDAA